MEHFKTPDPLIFSGVTNLSEGWRRWSQRFDLYLSASGKVKENEKTQVAILLHLMGEEGIEIYNTFTWEPADTSEKIKPVLEKFKNYCNPRKNTVIERYTFWNCKQKDGETVDQFVTELKTKAKNCEFGDQTNLMIRDRIIFGITDDRLKERLLRESDHTLEKVIDVCRAAEASKKQIKTIQAHSDVQIDSLTKKKEAPRHSRQNSYDTPRQNFPNSLGAKSQGGPINRPQFAKSQSAKYKPNKHYEKDINCKKCGNRHKQNSCPAYGKKCRVCHKYNHFSRQCYYNKSVHDVEETEDCEEPFFVGEITVHSIVKDNDSAWYSLIQVEDKTVKFKLDTGAEANIIPQSLYYKLPGHVLRSTKAKLSTYGNNIVTPIGRTTLPCKTKNEPVTKDLDFYVVGFKATPILGLSACKTLKLIEKIDLIEKVDFTKESLLKNNRDVFHGLGKFEGKYHIDIDTSVKPVVHPPRIIPHTLMPKLKESLNRLQEIGVIVPVEEATDWVNSLVVTEKKNGSLRLCLDPRDLNKAIKRQHFKIPTLDQITANLHGKSLFTILDEKDGYHQVELDTESSYLCTFQTPFGRYRYQRMPFGISSASEVFQRKNMQMFGDIEGVYMIADDMIIAGKDEIEHDQILKKVMDRANDKNVKFNPDKLQFKVKEVKYMGGIIGSDGLKADPEKIRAINDMPVPEDKKGIERLLGTINFLSPFIPNMSELTAPLRELLKKDIVFIWKEEHDEAMDKIKKVLTSNPVLSFYDVTQEVTIQTDASQNGLGSCIMQNNKPIAYASRALNEAEKNYAQIEKELLAVLFACERFNQYIYGKEVLVQTDHKPLEAIQNKPLYKTPPRLQRMLLRLQRYQLTLKYTPGKFMYLADTLSRAFTKEKRAENKVEKDDDLDVIIHAIVESLPFSDDRFEKMRQSTNSDQELQLLKETVQNGRPHHKSSLPDEIKQYWSIIDEIHTIDDLLFINERIIVPKDQRELMLSVIHESHLGIAKCKTRAKKSLYWPKMNQDIEQICSRCSICNTYKRRNQKETLIPHEVPDRPWQKVGIDIFEYVSNSYVLVVDFYSKFIEIRNMYKQKTATAVINSIKAIFSVHGIPETIIADNMPFNSKMFRTFAQSYNVKVNTSSPTYSQSNGMAERSIQTVKNLLKKAHSEGKDEYIALLEYRNTPIANCEYSPAQLLMSRMLRDKIPTQPKLLEPRVAENARQQLIERQKVNKLEYDKNAKTMSQLQTGDSVRYRQDKTWEPAVVVNQHQSPRSYIISTETGQTLRRNRRHLLKTNEAPITPLPPYELYSSESENNNSEEISSEKAAETPAVATPRITTPARPVLRPRRNINKPARFRDENFV